ncbi:DNA cytosine methyltransferase [Aliarcobacter cryaerophilus]|jgi:DNA-cytosine methyltransferase|uniref:DNA cytosine methyltransferase n=1 Tax=Aliarcobacter cryaerophilus TaxID=28198 RepID=UPI0021B53991|nr:DNA cytosine methyltransferase [Aliarcobacter cryaerophilus]MCT7492322.1 DNA cytosine methyltransferase [Aliarcobacter cryaerophilus]
MNNKKYRILDLFCGAGGFSFGLDSLNEFETKIGLDFDKNAIKTFERMFPEAEAICGDITSDKLKNYIIEKSKNLKINMIIGGPPCQGFSLKGKNLGIRDDRNFLFREYAYIVEKVNPEIFVIENVKNMISSGNGYFINEIKNLFKNMGYDIDYAVLNSKDFGVPQSRERTIIIGSNKKFIDLSKIKKNKQIFTVRDAISDLAYLSSGEGKENDKYKTEAQTEYQKKMRFEYLQYHKATSHSKETIAKLEMIPEEGDKSYLPKYLHGNQKFSTTWSRLIWDIPSPTIDTRFDTPSNGRNTHPFLNRAITPREAARIQSFPDSFIFEGNKSSVCKQIGNAVPPLLGRAIGEHILREMKSE